MAGSLNKVLLIGRLGNDPEIKQMVNGKSVARLSIATSNTWKDKNTGEKKEKTEWHRVVIFSEGLVKVVEQLKWKRKYSFERGLKETIDWYLKNQDWSNNISNKIISAYSWKTR